MRTYTYLLSLFACLMLLASKSMAQPYTLRHLGIEDGLSNNYVTDIVQDSQGCIWIATEAGLNRFNGKDFTVYNTHNSDIAGDALTRLLYDPEENKLWVGTKTGISLLDCRTQEFEQSTPFDSIDMNNNIVSISPAADGGIWVANHYGKIVHYNKTGGKVTILSRENIQGLPHSHWSVFDNGKGQLYVGHSGEGMSIIDLKSVEALGFQVAREVTRDDIREVDICFLEKDGYRVELVSPYSATSVVAGLLKKYKNCPYHICYETSHFEEALEELTSHGYVMMGSPTPAPAIDQHPVVFLMNASLGMIELLDLG